MADATPAAPVVAQKAPYGIELEAGKTYYWCSCGRSAKQPFCDGSHKGTGLTPMAYTPETAGKAWLCGCKASAKSPMCDGTHKKL
jgi:CDGSH-type Zn-finger protein